MPGNQIPKQDQIVASVFALRPVKTDVSIFYGFLAPLDYSLTEKLHPTSG